MQVCSGWRDGGDGPGGWLPRLLAEESLAKSRMNDHVWGAFSFPFFLPLPEKKKEKLTDKPRAKRQRGREEGRERI